jgi:protein KRI1
VKDRYGDVGLGDASDESTSESEDENAQELTKDVELEFFRALSLLKSKDSRIYDKEKTKFFENMAQADDEEEGGEEARREKKKSKPYQLKDLEREMVMEKVERAERGEKVGEEEEFENSAEAKRDAEMRESARKRGYFEEQEDIKKK